MNEGKRRLFMFEINFLPNRKGEIYELESMRLKVRAEDSVMAQDRVEHEAAQCWPHFEIEFITECAEAPNA